MKTIAEKLQKLMEDGSLTKQDLQRWLGRPYPTVRMWIIGFQEPWAIWRDDVDEKVMALETLVRKRDDFPIPPSYSRADRKELIERLARERDAQLPRSRSAARR